MSCEIERVRDVPAVVRHVGASEVDAQLDGPPVTARSMSVVVAGLPIAQVHVIGLVRVAGRVEVRRRALEQDEPAVAADAQVLV